MEADQNLAQRTIKRLQNEHLKTANNYPVGWRPLALEFGVTEDELNAAQVKFFASDALQLVLKPVTLDTIRLGIEGLAAKHQTNSDRLPCRK